MIFFHSGKLFIINKQIKTINKNTFGSVRNNGPIATITIRTRTLPKIAKT